MRDEVYRVEGCCELLCLAHAPCQSFVDPFHLSSLDFPFSFAILFPVPFVPRAIHVVDRPFWRENIDDKLPSSHTMHLCIRSRNPSPNIIIKNAHPNNLSLHHHHHHCRQCHASSIVINASYPLPTSPHPLPRLVFPWHTGVEFSLVPDLVGRLPVVRSQADSENLFIRIIIEARDWFLSHLGRKESRC